MLRSGNVHSADRWQEVLAPAVERYQRKGVRLLFRGDAAFAKPEIHEYLELRVIRYAIRLPANNILEQEIKRGKAPEWQLAKRRQLSSSVQVEAMGEGSTCCLPLSRWHVTGTPGGKTQR